MAFDDETLPVTPDDVNTPFLFGNGGGTKSIFNALFYPTQGGAASPNLAGELRGLYGRPGALDWKPEWSTYHAQRPGKTHWGVDIYAPVGTPLVAVCNGKLDYANDPGGMGLYARLEFTAQGKVYVFHYGHLSAKSGAPRSVMKGDVIGFVGCDGNAGVDGICQVSPPGLGFSSSHVHFALVPPHPTDTVKRSNPLTVLGWTLATPNRPPGL
ncbi:M23 family metallopeptidase [Burkholderia vietnamiensis]|uniref:M23 family metallopeptidase n=1 Tax=Burkholderia vietnamiensis TaxID=60552 RepID=UPI001CF3581E|nr:M23 family metallopeptidase [Burkholderia vietnamiensis]MCA8448564.1 M23 family metallopeptidase [Burkholderia vietnamiensis]HDR8955664.1 M23 family metallopeptidase [Burkholderia vietnamiensis]